MINKIPIGTTLNIENKFYTVIGSITYINKSDKDKIWTEYRLLDDREYEYWLSIDNTYEEYSLSEPTTLIDNQIPVIWNKVDEGVQVVIAFEGDVDVDMGEEAEFIEHEDDAEEEILSIEIWEDGTEVSHGYYIEDEDIIMGKSVFFQQKKHHFLKNQLPQILIFLLLIAASVFYEQIHYGLVEFSFEAILNNGELADRQSKDAIHNFLEMDENYQYVTSISGAEQQFAKVYQSKLSKFSPKINELKQKEAAIKLESAELKDSNYQIIDPLIDYLVKDLILSAKVPIEKVTEHIDDNGLNVAVLTDWEYCLFYHPEEDQSKVYIQISNRKYNYSTDQKPYHASQRTFNWYRQNYYHSAYKRDAGLWKNTPSSYTKYKGNLVKDLGNGYYDLYTSKAQKAGSIRQGSVGTRKSRSGGLGLGK